MGDQMTRRMKYKTFAVLVLVLLGFPPRGHSQNNSLQKLFSDYYEFQLREDPGQATFLGRTEYNDRWDDPSPEHQQQHRKSLQQFLGRLQAIPEKPLTGQDRLSYRLLDWQLRDQIADAEIISTFYSVNQLIGGHLNIFSVVAIAPAETVKDYENQIARLRALPRWVDQTIAAANLAIAEKKIQPRLVADREAVQLDLEMVSEPLQSPLLKAFTKFPDAIPAAEQERLRASAVDAYSQAFLPAWHKLRNYVLATYIPAARDSVGLSQAPGGAAMYAFSIKHMTTTDYTPDQIHEIGLKEVARTQSEMLKIRQQLNFTGSAEEFSDQLLNAPRFHFHSEEEILIHGRDIAKRIDPELPRLFKILPRMT